MNETDIITVYCPKYALTQGILELRVEKTEGSALVLVVEPKTSVSWYLHGEGKEWCRTFEEAVAIAERARTRKIASLKKNIKKMETMKFSVIPYKKSER